MALRPRIAGICGITAVRMVAQHAAEPGHGLGAHAIVVKCPSVYEQEMMPIGWSKLRVGTGVHEVEVVPSRP